MRRQILLFVLSEVTSHCLRCRFDVFWKGTVTKNILPSWLLASELCWRLTISTLIYPESHRPLGSVSDDIHLMPFLPFLFELLQIGGCLFAQVSLRCLRVQGHSWLRSENAKTTVSFIPPIKPNAILYAFRFSLRWALVQPFSVVSYLINVIVLHVPPLLLLWRNIVIPWFLNLFKTLRAVKYA